MTGVSLGTVEIVSNIAGTNVSFPVSLYIDIFTKPEGVELNLFAQIGMGELQAKFDAIVKSYPMSNDMSGYGTKINAHVNNASLTSVGDIAVIKAGVNVEIWQIEKGIPGGGATVRWETRCVDLPFGGKVCADVPVKVEIKPSPDIKLKILEDDVSGSISMSMATPDGKSIEIRPNSASVTPKSDLGKFFNDIARIFNVDLSSLAQREIAEILNDGTLRQALPKEILAYNPIIKAVQFSTASSGTLEAHIQFQALLTGEQLAELLKKSVGK